MPTKKKTLHRRNAPTTSVEAAYAVKHTKWENIVLAEIIKAGDNGLTQDEVLALYPSAPYSTITARFASLKIAGKINRPGDMRKSRSGRNQLVMYAAKGQD